MRLAIGLVACLGVAVMTSSCGDEEEKSLPSVDCSQMIPTFAMLTGFQKCAACHDSTKTDPVVRQQADPAFNFDNAAAAAHDPEETAHEIFEGKMPPEGFVHLEPTEPEKQAMYLWLLCGTPG